MISTMLVLFFALAVLCGILYLLEHVVEHVPIRRGLQALALLIFLFALARHYGYV